MGIKWTDGDDLHVHHNKLNALNEQRARKISEGNRGKKRNAETVKRMSEAQKLKYELNPVTEETKRKLSEYGKANPNRSMLGKNLSEEAKEKLRQHNLGKIRPEHEKEKIRKTWQEKPLHKCTVCGFETRAVGAIKRYHNERCGSTESRNEKNSHACVTPFGQFPSIASAVRYAKENNLFTNVDRKIRNRIKDPNYTDYYLVDK